MKILDRDWLVKSPFDYELKTYKLLGALKLMRSELNSGVVYPILIEVEEHLQELYVIKYNKDIIDDRLKVLKGINVDTMSLEYEYPEHDQTVTDLYELCDRAIIAFEEIYKDIRIVWRNIEKQFTVTEIPESRKTFNHTYIFLIIEKKKTIIYESIFPSAFQESWKNINLIEFEKSPYSIEHITNFIEQKDKTGNFRFFRFDVKKDLPLDETILPITKMIIFNKLKIG